MPDHESRLTQPPSPRISSSSARQTVAPSYLSPRSADVILSEVRPTRIKSDALRSVNVLLDELLWLILGYARSFATERLRMGLLKILPTGLGKDALLEAEVELRAYIERNPPLTALSVDEATIQKFPLQPAFELLRIKCEAYSSLGDQTENTEAESTLHSRMVQIAGDAAPKLSAIAPAALYLTAILEHICEHVLTNVGRVVARDSSRTTAHAQDLYVALCEDESIYSLFKTMKVQEQIEQQAKAPAPRRSKSISRNDIVPEPPPPEHTSDVPPATKTRRSMDSAVSNGSNNNLSNRPSADKSRTKLFKNASSRSLVTDHGNSNSGDAGPVHRRSNSLLGGDKKNPSSDNAEVSADILAADGDSMQDFDILMRSGTTMKVSLTPDRLKTFEVFAKEKNQRAGRPGNVPSPSSGKDSATSSSFSNGVSHTQPAKQQPTRGSQRVGPIAEAPEDTVRSASVTTPLVPNQEKSQPSPRTRSHTEARPSNIDNKPEPSQTKPGDTVEVASTSRRNMPVPFDAPIDTPKRVHRGAVRRRESMDLDDIMNGSDDDLLSARKVSMTPKSAQATASGTRDLVDFLSEGPPEPPMDLPVSPNPSTYDPQRPGKGRFRTIVSRLTGSTSNERLSPRAGEEGLDGVRRPSNMGANESGLSLRPPPLTSKKAPNAAVGPRFTPHSPSQASPPQIHGHTLSPPTSRTRQPSQARKAVPNLESRDVSKEKGEPSLHPSKPTPRPSDTQKALPDPATLSTVQSPDSNGIVSSARKRVPRESEQSKVSAPPVVTPAVATPGSPSNNGHPKARQESAKQPPPVPLRSERRATSEQGSTEPTPVPVRLDRHAPALALSIPPDELVRDLRDLMSRATTVDECRVLMEIFFARCGASGDRQLDSGPITPPVSPIRPEIESRHESNLIAVLLSDSPTSPISTSAGTAAALPEGTSTPKPTDHTHHRPIDSSGGRGLQSQSDPIVTTAVSPVAAVASA